MSLTSLLRASTTSTVIGDCSLVARILIRLTRGGRATREYDAAQADLAAVQNATLAGDAARRERRLADFSARLDALERALAHESVSTSFRAGRDRGARRLPRS